MQLGCKTKPRQSRMDANLIRIAAGNLEIVTKAIVLLHLGLQRRTGKRFHFMGDVMDRALKLQQMPDAGVHLLHNRAFAAESRLLSQVTDGQALLLDYPANVRGDLACDQVQDCTLTFAVGSDHTDLFAWMQRKIQLIQNDLGAEGYMNII